MTTLNIELPDAMLSWIEEQVIRARSTTSEFVRQLIAEAQTRERAEHLEAWLLEDLDCGPAPGMTQAEWDDWKRRARENLDRRLLEGLDSGPAIEVDADYWDNLRARVAARAQTPAEQA